MDNKFNNSYISEQELNAIRFYMGDPQIVAEEVFCGGPKAYVTINALLHHGIQNEVSKIREGKKLEIYDVEHLRSYMYLMKDIYTAMEKYCCLEENTHLLTYRIDRVSTIESLQKNRKIEGFFSSCKWGFLREYANTKAEVVLLEIERRKDVPYLDFELLFEEYYAKPQEAEILLPFGAEIEALTELPLSQEEKELYKDMNGAAPAGKYRLLLKKPELIVQSEVENDDLWKEVVSESAVRRVQECLEKLQIYENLTGEDMKFYCEWKEKLICIVQSRQ